MRVESVLYFRNKIKQKEFASFIMNVNQQSEIEDLFKRIGKSQAKNAKITISEDDLNKVRAFVVQS